MPLTIGKFASHLNILYYTSKNRMNITSSRLNNRAVNPTCRSVILLCFESAAVQIEVQKQDILAIAHKCKMRARIEMHSSVNSLAVRPVVDAMLDRRRLLTINKDDMAVFVGGKAVCRSRYGSLA